MFDIKNWQDSLVNLYIGASNPGFTAALPWFIFI